MRPDPKLLCTGVIAVLMSTSNAHAGTTRTEYRYPDRPDLVYSSDGNVRRANEDRPMAFSTFEAAISAGDAQRLMNDAGFESELPRRIPQQTTSSPTPPPLFEPVPVEPVVSAPAGYVIQAGAFGSYENAQRLSQQLSGFGATRIVESFKNGKSLYRVYLGSWSQKQDAVPMLDLIRARGFDGFVTKAG